MVIVIGSSNIDFSVTVDRFPAAGETILAHHLTQSFGGKGANQAVAAARAGAQVRFLSKVGMDANGIWSNVIWPAKGSPPSRCFANPKPPRE